MVNGMKLFYLILVFIAVNSFFFAISYIMPGVKQRDVLPFQLFLFVLLVFYKTLPSNTKFSDNDDI